MTPAERPAPDPLAAWLESRTAQAPTELRARVLEQALAMPASDDLSVRLAMTAERVLSAVEEHPGDRTVALDLLAADALITLALLAQAEQAPARLGAFAEDLLAAERVGL